MLPTQLKPPAMLPSKMLLPGILVFLSQSFLQPRWLLCRDPSRCQAGRVSWMAVGKKSRLMLLRCSLFACYEWATTDRFDEDEHGELLENILIGNGLPSAISTREV